MFKTKSHDTQTIIYLTVNFISFTLKMRIILQAYNKKYMSKIYVIRLANCFYRNSCISWCFSASPAIQF